MAQQVGVFGPQYSAPQLPQQRNRPTTTVARAKADKLKRAGSDPLGLGDAHVFLQTAPTAQAAPQKKGNFITNLLPSAGGITGGVGGGALGGALAGSAVLPGIGTAAGALIGALAGGAAGGAAGKVAENKLEGNALGDGVAKEAGVQGIFSAGPIRLAKVLGAAGKAGVTGKGVAGALEATNTTAAAPGLIARTLGKQGRNLKADVSGVGKVSDSFTQENQLLMHTSLLVSKALAQRCTSKLTASSLT